MHEQISDVFQFRALAELPVAVRPRLIPAERWELHVKLLQEEVGEYQEACEQRDKVAILDALVDIAYILCGAIIDQGMGRVFLQAWRRVNTANLKKVEGEIKRREDGKILKPDDWQPPYLNNLV